MSAAGIAWIAALALAAGPDPAVLVARLGAARYAEREAAAATLEELGGAALPALNHAREARDPEVQTRVATLIERIESRMMVQPSRVTLDVEDRPLGEVLAAFGRMAGPPPAIGVPDSSLLARRVTVHAERSLPFWEAIDRLCRAGRLASTVVPSAGSDGRGPAVGVVLTAGDGRIAPACYWGPFRVSVARLQRNHEIVLEPGAGQVADSDQFQVHLQLLAEPRLIFGCAGAVSVIEAVDDRGQSLVPGPSLNTPGLIGLDEGDDIEPVELVTGAALPVPISLTYPERPGRLVKRLQGRLPVVLAARRPEPAIVPLEGSEGKTFHGRDLTVTVQYIRPDPNDPQTTIELLIQPRGRDAGSTELSDPMAPAFLEHQIEVQDRQGRLLAWVPQQIDREGGGARIVLVVVGDAGGGPPTRLRVFGLSRARAEVGFDFRDLQMP